MLAALRELRHLGHSSCGFSAGPVMVKAAHFLSLPPPVPISCVLRHADRHAHLNIDNKMGCGEGGGGWSFVELDLHECVHVRTCVVLGS